MISFAQSYISYLPGYSIFPGLAIMITVIAFNIFGDGLRDALDPKDEESVRKGKKNVRKTT